MSAARVDAPGVAGFVAVTFGTAWLAAAPLWLSGQGWPRRARDSFSSR